MTRKSTLIEWGHHLGVVSDARQGQEMTAAELEQGISAALVQRDRAAGEDEPDYSLGEAITNNWQVLKSEAIPTAKAIAANLRS